MLLLFLLGVAAAFLGENAANIRFESSDGLWCDSTCPLKGRGFRIVLVDFEKYRLKAKNPEVTLVRTTRPLLWFFPMKRSPEWNVPYAPPSGYAKPFWD